jgi:hypothetical protein
VDIDANNLRISGIQFCHNNPKCQSVKHLANMFNERKFNQVLENPLWKTVGEKVKDSAAEYSYKRLNEIIKA